MLQRFTNFRRLGSRILRELYSKSTPLGTGKLSISDAHSTTGEFILEEYLVDKQKIYKVINKYQKEGIIKSEQRQGGVLGFGRSPINEDGKRGRRHLGADSALAKIATVPC